MKPPRFQDEVPRARTLESVDYEAVFEAVCDYYQVDRAILSERGDGHLARAAAAWLSRRLTTATLRELASPLGLGRPESVSNLTRRMERQLAKVPSTKKELARIEARLARRTKNKV
jgi:chromosomal replication initiation ATPase DnaA